MERHTHTMSVFSTSPQSAVSGIATSHSGVMSITVAARTSPPPRRTPTMAVLLNALGARKIYVTVCITVAKRQASGESPNSG